MKKILTGTPIPALFVFVLFIYMFNLLTHNYYVESYEKIECEITEINQEYEKIVVKLDENIPIKLGDKIRLVYSKQEQIKKGKIEVVKDNLAEISISGLKTLSKSQIQNAEIMVCNGEKSIGSELKLWE